MTRFLQSDRRRIPALMLSSVVVLIPGVLSVAQPLCAADGARVMAASMEEDEFSSNVEQILASEDFRHIGRLRDSGQISRSDEAEDNSNINIPKSPIELPSEALSIFGNILAFFAWAGIALVVALIIFLVIKTWIAPRWSKAPKDKHSLDIEEGDDGLHVAPGQLTVDEYLARAREFAGQQEYREAISQLLLGAMSWIERRDLIRFRRGLTHRDYLRASRPQPAQHSAFYRLLTTYEPLGFGRRVASQSTFENSLLEYEQSFGRQETISHE